VARTLEDIEFVAGGSHALADHLCELHGLLYRDQRIEVAMLDEDGRHAWMNVVRGISGLDKLGYLGKGST
jgi:hypothetical protein